MRPSRPQPGAGLDGLGAVLAGTANVIMQLSRPAVGYGVVESRVESGQVTRHPLKRFRTTFTYLAVALMGTDAERDAYRRAVDSVHAQVRSGPESPVRYNAFDPDLQLWVAACLYRGAVDLQTRLHGPLDDAAAERFYREAARLATTLQVRPEKWPADRAAFERYWEEALESVSMDEPVREYLRGIARLRFLPGPLGALAGPFHQFLTVGFLPARFRDEMGLGWDERSQRRFDRLMEAVAVISRVSPGPLREFPFNACLWDFRLRRALGRRLL